MTCMVAIFLTIVMISVVSVKCRYCSKLSWDMMICRKGDQVKGQADIILVDGRREPYDLSPVILLCRQAPCLSSFPGGYT